MESKKFLKVAKTHFQLNFQRFWLQKLFFFIYALLGLLAYHVLAFSATPALEYRKNAMLMMSIPLAVILKVQFTNIKLGYTN